MNDSQKAELMLVTSIYLENLTEQTSRGFVALVKRATNITANVNKMHVENVSYEEVQKFINESSKDLGLLTVLAGHDPETVMEESDKLYEFMFAEAANLTGKKDKA